MISGDTAIPWQELEANDPEIFAAYRGMEHASRRGALTPLERELIRLAIAASCAHVFEPAMRLHLQRARELGATRAQLLDVLRLASVIGIHCLIPAVELLVEQLGGMEASAAACSSEQRQRAEDLKARFRERRGFWPEAWNPAALLSPAFLEAYTEYSSVPVGSGALSERLRELILLAVDVSPTHFHVIGARSHMQRALSKGASHEQVLETIELAALIGFNTCVAGLPMIDEVAP